MPLNLTTADIAVIIGATALGNFIGSALFIAYQTMKDARKRAEAAQQTLARDINDWRKKFDEERP